MEQLQDPQADLPDVDQNLFSDVVNVIGQNNKSQHELETIMKNLTPYLSPNDMKLLRGICRGLNLAIIGLETFGQSFSCKLSKKWYNGFPTWDPSQSVQWKSITLQKFTFHRNSKALKDNWTHTAQRLTHLTLKKSSLECDGFAHLLNLAPNLESLTMDGIRCRDLKHVHVDANMEAGNTLRHVAFKNINIMGDCFLDYLVNRTGNVEKLQVENCFSRREIEVPVVPELNIAQRFAAFLPKMVNFVMHNAQSITSLSLKKNGNQSEFLNLLAQHPNHAAMNVHLTEVELEFPSNEFNPMTSVLKQPHEQFPPTVQFLQSKTGLQKLSIELNGHVAQNVLVAMILPQQNRLASLVLQLPALPHAQLQLDFLVQLAQLQSLNLDYKINLERPRRELRNIRTPIQAEFIHTLPEQLNEFSMRGFLYGNQNIFLPQNVEQNFATRSQNLTKFELIGPLLKRIQRPVLSMIITNFVNLTSLTLQQCGLLDMHFIGVAWHGIVRRIERGWGRPNADLDRVFQIATRLPEWRPLPPRPTLRALTRLEYLDISKNGWLSDVAIHDLQFNSLKTLNVKNCNAITNRGLGFIGRFNPSLEVIHLENVRKITKQGLNEFIGQCRNLKKIYTTKVVGKLTREDATALGFNPQYFEIMDFVARRNCWKKNDPELEREEDGGDANNQD